MYSLQAKHGTLGLFKLIAALGQPQNISTSLIVPWYPDVPLVEDRYLKAEPIPRRILDKGISGMLYATVNSDADGQLVLIHACVRPHVLSFADRADLWLAAAAWSWRRTCGRESMRVDQSRLRERARRARARVASRRVRFLASGARLGADAE